MHSGAEGEFQGEPLVGIVQGPAEQLAELGEPVAHGLRVDVEFPRDVLSFAAVPQPGEEGRGEPVAGARAQVGEGRQRALRQLADEVGLAVQDQGREVLVDPERVAGEQAALDERDGERRPGAGSTPRRRAGGRGRRPRRGR